MGGLSAVRELLPLLAGGKGLEGTLQVVRLPERLDLLRHRAVAAHREGDLEAFARRAVLVVLERFLVLRPFHVATLSVRATRRTLLLDGASRACWGELPQATAERLLSLACSEAPSPGGWSLKAMRCPICAGPLPLQRAEEVHFCRTCGRAFASGEDALHPLPFTVELPATSAPLVLPFWRLPFALCDPRDGARVASLAELRARLHSRAPDEGGRDREGAIEVPAFPFLERRWPFREVRRLLDEAPEVAEVQQGPLPSGLGVRRPARLVAVAPAEALAVGRLALLLAVSERDLAGALPGRIRQLLFDAPLSLGAPRLVLRGFERRDLDRAVAAPRR
jgi:hypothetical protein